MSFNSNQDTNEFGRRDQWDPTTVASNADPTSFQTTTYPGARGEDFSSTSSDPTSINPTQPLSSSAIRPGDIQPQPSGRAAVPSAAPGVATRYQEDEGYGTGDREVMGGQGEWNSSAEGLRAQQKQQQATNLDEENDGTSGPGAGAYTSSGSPTPGGKPKFTDKMIGTMEKAAGKVTGNTVMQERGQDRKTGGL
ncbi:hypothetical protein JAAARDRAFT_54651 [Jaapia argillacea MUCL 33604]|uniref:Uncharacterized protein n=1 Tax=Jaapia argillacea MUCL 33604 TaxID=933084 RepID=A0A067QGV9_9AGAM|nr:hypothetical protein JAAARDRAFT_54651 [Jaapia argillacea MUCL 33604]